MIRDPDPDPDPDPNPDPNPNPNPNPRRHVKHAGLRGGYDNELTQEQTVLDVICECHNDP